MLCGRRRSGARPADGNNNAGASGGARGSRAKHLALGCCPCLFRARKPTSAELPRTPTPILQLDGNTSIHTEINKDEESDSSPAHKSEGSHPSEREVSPGRSLAGHPSAGSAHSRLTEAPEDKQPTPSRSSHNEAVRTPTRSKEGLETPQTPGRLSQLVAEPQKVSTPRHSPQKQSNHQIEYSEDDEVYNVIEERSSRAPSGHELRFINDAQEIDVVDYAEEDTYEEERFINLKRESPTGDFADRISHASAKFSAKEKSARSSAHSTHSFHSIHSAHSGKSQGFPSPARNRSGTSTPVVITPAIALMGSSISTEEEVKSVESAFSEASLKGSVRSFGSEENEKPNGDVNALMNKTSPLKRPKILKPVGKGVNGKISKNKVQPLQNENSGSKPFEKPKEAMVQCLGQLEKTEWESVVSGLQGLQRLMLHHPILMEAHLSVAARAVATQVRNLRSQVARAACRLAGEMFTTQKKALEGDADELACALLHRTADTNKFIRSDANAALDRMCESITPQKAIIILMTRGAAHQNGVVKCATARLLADIVRSSGAEKIFGIHKEVRDKLLQTGADLLTEGSLETRGHAKRLLKVLAQYSGFIRTMREVILPSKYRNIEKALNSLKTQ